MRTRCPFCDSDRYMITTAATQYFKASYGCANCDAYISANSIDEAIVKWKQYNPNRTEIKESIAALCKALNVKILKDES